MADSPPPAKRARSTSPSGSDGFGALLAGGGSDSSELSSEGVPTDHELDTHDTHEAHDPLDERDSPSPSPSPSPSREHSQTSLPAGAHEGAGKGTGGGAQQLDRAGGVTADAADGLDAAERAVGAGGGAVGAAGGGEGKGRDGVDADAADDADGPDGDGTDDAEDDLKAIEALAGLGAAVGGGDNEGRARHALAAVCSVPVSGAGSREALGAPYVAAFFPAGEKKVDKSGGRVRSRPPVLLSCMMDDGKHLMGMLTPGRAHGIRKIDTRMPPPKR